MRRLLPQPTLDNVDLDEAYWVDDPGRQHVRANMVSSADGAAQARGKSEGLSGPADKRLFSILRNHADVLLAGASTVRIEGYGGHKPAPHRRQWRLEHDLAEAPPIAVVTRSCALDPEGPLFTDSLVPPIVITHRSAPAGLRHALAERADVIVEGDGDVDLPRALDALAERGLRRVSCEGGPNLLSHVVAAGRLDELCLTVSPRLLGGAATRILDGPLVEPQAQMRLQHLLEDDDGFLFLRYSLR